MQSIKFLSDFGWKTPKPKVKNLHCNLCGEPGVFDFQIFWCKECKIYVHLLEVVDAKIIKEVGPDFSTPNAVHMILDALECGHVLEWEEEKASARGSPPKKFTSEDQHNPDTSTAWGDGKSVALPLLLFLPSAVVETLPALSG